ncbi:MAG: DUF1971 domain-containing protein [Planctomycetota bacterium]
MNTRRLPPGAVPKGASPTFTEETLPAALRDNHALGAGRWGVLHLLNGEVTYVDLVAGEESALKAPAVVTIPPSSAHKLRPGGTPFRLRVDFFVERDGEAPLREHEPDRANAARRSLARCEAAGDFAAKFYELFLAISPDVAAAFARTDFDKQRKLLRASVVMLVSRDVEDPKVRELLGRIGETHARDRYDIPPLLYEMWLESLCATVAALDPEWDEGVEAAWRDRMRAGIQIITASY